MISRLGIIAWKELRQLRRDRMTLAMTAALPVLQLLLFGYAINIDVRHIPTVVCDRDQTAESRDFYRSMEATTFYDVIGHVRDESEIEASLRSGAAKVALVIPPRYGSNVASGRPAPLQLIVDGTDPQTTGSALNTATGLAAARAQELIVRKLGAAPDLIRMEPMIWYNPDQRTAVNIVPGIIGVILTMTMVMLTAMAVVRERERGTLEQLIVSPVKNIELIVGKIVPYIAIGYVQMTLILAIGYAVFDVPFVGSLPLLYSLTFVFIAANLALGLFFSTLAHSQQQAMQMSFFFLLPNILLSGFMFPFEAMPRPAQWISQALPLTHFLRIVRGVTLKGGTLQDVSQELYWLSGVLGALVLLASLRFSKKVA